MSEDGTVPADEKRADATLGARHGLGLALWVVGAVTVFVVHFRPWQQGLLEDWGLAVAWRQEGIAGYAARLPLTMGRPVHLLPQYLGMALTNGGFVGPYLVLGLIAVAQFATAAWALKVLAPPRLLRFALALAIALHPWWAAGDILRFMPAQLAVLGVIVWLGSAGRYLEGGRALWLAVAVAGPLVGLLAYQGPLVALLIGAFALASASAASVRRRLMAFGSAIGTAGAVLVWSMVIAPAISPASYEAQLESGKLDVRASLVDIAKTMAHHTPALLLAWLIVVALILELAFSRRIGHGRSWVLFLAAASAPLAAMAYASTPLHLHDAERVGLPVGVASWLVLCVAARSIVGARVVPMSLTGLLVVGSILGAATGYHTWTTYAAAQQSLVTALEPIRASAPAGSTLVVADQSGRWGDVYLLLPPHLNLAMLEEQGPGPDVSLCTADGVVRNQPVAEAFPIATTPDCAPLLADGSRAATHLSLSTGDVLVYVRPKS